MDRALCFIGEKIVPILVFLFIAIGILALLVFIVWEISRVRKRTKRRIGAKKRLRKWIRIRQKIQKLEKKEPKQSLRSSLARLSAAGFRKIVNVKPKGRS